VLAPFCLLTSALFDLINAGMPASSSPRLSWSARYDPPASSRARRRGVTRCPRLLGPGDELFQPRAHCRAGRGDVGHHGRRRLADGWVAGGHDPHPKPGRRIPFDPAAQDEDAGAVPGERSHSRVVAEQSLPGREHRVTAYDVVARPQRVDQGADLVGWAQA
jgi:hypothetical protein